MNKKLPAVSKKKYRASLPADFQEVLMSTEMELQQGLTVPILRKLVYLYTRGMQYYDLIHKDKFKQFYSEKLISLLTRKNVEKFLDQNPINFDDEDDLDKLFNSKEQKPGSKIENDDNEKDEIDNDTKNDEFDDVMKDFSSKVRKNSMKLVKKKITDFDIGLIVKAKLFQLNNNLNNIDKALSNEMIEQMTEFEENKRKRKIMKPKNIILNENNNNNENNENEIKENEIIIKNDDIIKEKDNNKENQESDTNSISNPSSNDEESNQNTQNLIKSTEDELKILELSGLNDTTNSKIEEEKEKDTKADNNNNNTPTKNLIGNNPMLREIEDYVQKNMNEMYQALEELKASFADDIKEAEENGFEDIAEGLKQDLQVELDNLKDQYEEQRRTETEKIKEKYSKRNVIID